MKKNIQNLKPDTVLKNYWNDNEQFADLFNAVLFDGKQIIESRELTDVDTEESSVLEHRDYAESIKASRDNIKIQKKSSKYGMQFVLLGMESQEHIHYAMPMRIMGYDYGVYKKQYDSNAKQYKTAQGMEKDEYLSKMKKTDKLIAVVTVTIYYGKNPWDGAKSLHEMLDIPVEMKNYVNDYKMLLIEARKNELIFHNMNNINLFSLLNSLLDKSKTLKEIKEQVLKYTKEHLVDKSVIMAVAAATNCKLDYNILDKKGEVDMCTLFEEIAKEGEEKGRAEGRAEGKAEGRAEGKAKGIIKILKKYNENDNTIIMELVEELYISKSMAEDYLDKYNKGIL